MTTTLDLERRLRMPAPDEPAVLPSLLLPTDIASLGRARRTSFRSPLAPVQQARLVWVVIALLLVLAAMISAGALRERQSELTRLGLVCQPDQGLAIHVNCASVAIPQGWVTLASGQIMPGDFTEIGLGYEVVDLVIASVPLGDCPTTPGPFPPGIPIGSFGIEQPYPTPDPGLACLRAAPLPANAVRVVTMRGSRILGLDEQGGGIPDTSEPTAEAGWTAAVAGRPAKLTVHQGTGAPGEPMETRTWDILVPGSIDGVLRIRADIAGPDVTTGRATVQSILDSVTFDATVPPLRESDANDVLGRVLDTLDRMTREERSDFYGCFPREPGSAAGTISGSPGGPFASSLDVTCSSSISPSRAGVWRIVLDVSWEGTDAYAADTIRTELFSTGAVFNERSAEFTGGYTSSLAGRPAGQSGFEEWFPVDTPELPPVLTGPLDLPPGSIVEMLPPGEPPQPDRSMVDDANYAGIVGTHLIVLDGPELVDGEAWYRVQGGNDVFPEIAWVRGTRDGRPQLAIVEPTCPAGDATVGDLTWLIAAERLACFAGIELAFEAALLARNQNGEVMCSDGDGAMHTCAPGHPDWLTTFTVWELYGAEGPTGPYPALPAWLHPSVGEPPEGELLRIVGRFDHPEARGCRWPTDGSAGPTFDDPAFEELLCRERFVITAFDAVGG